MNTRLLPPVLFATPARAKQWLRAAAASLLVAHSYWAYSAFGADLDNVVYLASPFVQNAGQWNDHAAFGATTFAGSVFVTRDAQLVYSLPANDRGKLLCRRESTLGTEHCAAGSRTTYGWVLTETMTDAHGKPMASRRSARIAPTGLHPLDGKVSFAIGNDASRHRSNLTTFERVDLGELYPGVNVQLRATGRNVEKIFTVAPHHDPDQINIKIDGALGLELGDQGELLVQTGNGSVRFTAPIAYQENGGIRRSVPVRYALAPRDGSSIDEANDSGREYSYRFILGEYDSTKPLIIDPLLQSTYLGGTGDDRAHAIAVHPTNGEVYIAGITNSTDFPSTTTANGGVATGAQITISTLGDAFVARFNSSLTARLQASYFGGSGTDIANAISIHPATGDVYVVGHTDSSNLPSLTVASGGVATGAQSVKSIGNDGFVARFNAALTAIPQVSYLGGFGDDYARAVAVHPATGEVYVAGYTGSPDLPGSTVALGGVASGAQNAKAAGNDSVVARFNANLTALPQSTYFGGNGSFDYAQAIAIQPATGEIYISGYTDSTDLPRVSVASGGVAAGAQSTKSGGLDAFVARFNAALTQSPQASYHGGNGTDIAYAVAVHPTTGEVYLAGYTDSGAMPAVAGGAQSARSGNDDAFVVRFNAALTARPQASYLGGNGSDRAFALAIHPGSGEIYLGGNTNSDDFPSTTTALGGLSSGAQSTNSVFGDTFVARLSAALTSRPQASYAGGGSTELALGLAIHPTTGEVYLTGYTQSTDFPSRTVASGGVAEGAQSVKSSGNDAFVARFSYELASAALACSLDIDASGGAPVASTDGGMLLRAMLGLPDSAITTDLVSGTPPRDTWPAMRHYLNNSCGTNFAPVVRPPFVGVPCDLDLDGSGGAPHALSDGLMLVRAMLGLTGTAVTNGAISGSPPRNTWPLIRQYLNDRCGANYSP